MSDNEMYYDSASDLSGSDEDEDMIDGTQEENDSGRRSPCCNFVYNLGLPASQTPHLTTGAFQMMIMSLTPS